MLRACLYAKISHHQEKYALTRWDLPKNERLIEKPIKNKNNKGKRKLQTINSIKSPPKEACNTLVNQEESENQRYI